MTTKPTAGTDAQIALGRRFRNAREEKSITLRQISSMMGMSINTIRWHEAGTRCLRADDLVTAARLIGCPAGHLFQGPDDEDQALEALAVMMGIAGDALRHMIGMRAKPEDIPFADEDKPQPGQDRQHEAD